MASLPQPSTDQILRIHCVKIFVRDQEQSLRFYLDQLGFRLIADTLLQSGERWLAVAPPDGDTVLALVAPKPDSKLHQLIGRPTDVVFVTDDVLARCREWSRRGVRMTTPLVERSKEFESIASLEKSRKLLERSEKPPIAAFFHACL
jgi:Glyoxalase/Bleomycin resistance protein/Dioxygenase superfamily